MTRRSFLSGLAGISAVSTCGADADPWPPDDLVEPAAFAEQLRADPGRFAVFYTGFPVLYRSARIQGATLAGPCSKSQGLAQLRTALQAADPKQAVLIYCGCCPFDRCPNIRPAYSTALAAGARAVKVLHIPTNLHTDWIVPGYPTDKTPV